MNKINTKKRSFLYIGIAIIVLAIGAIIYMNSSDLEDYEKLEQQLPDNYRVATATITKIDEIETIKIRNKIYEEGFLYTFVFSAKKKKYMGNYFSKTREKEINETVEIRFLPENPTVNELNK